jgi:hypothetical protein
MATQIENGNSIAACEHSLDIMFDDDGAHVLITHHLANMLKKVPCLAGRKPCSGFVHEQKARSSEKC